MTAGVRDRAREDAPRQGAVGVVCALVVDRAARARVRELLRGIGWEQAEVVFLERVAELHAVVLARRPAAVIVEPRDALGLGTDDAIRRLRTGFASVPVLGFVRLSRTTSTDVLLLARAGVHELVIQGLDDEAVVFRAALQSARLRAVATRVERILAPHVPAAAWPIFRYALEHVMQPLSVPEVADALGVHRRTLVNRLRSAGLPGPREFLAWMRLLVAAGLLQDVARPVEHVALELDYPSANAFRNVLRRYTAMAPADVRRPGGFEALVAVLVDTLAAARRAQPAESPESSGA